ncbi:hypothetical protein ACHAPU_000622 [Fusarium lateritium]
MKLLWLLSLLVGLGSAADLGVWDFDPSCEEHRDTIQKAYDDAEYMAVRAHEDLYVITHPRPKHTPETLDELKNWDRVARAVTNMFGFVPDQNGHDLQEQYLAEVLYVFDRMITTLKFGRMVPGDTGYGGNKPLMFCDRDVFQWVDRNEKDPNDPVRTLAEVRGQHLAGAAGAWVYKRRYIPEAEKRDSVSICTPGQWAVTNTGFDFLAICPKSFRGPMAGTRSAVDVKDEEQTGANTLDQYSYTCLSRTLVHELSHWFGGSGDGRRIRGVNRWVPDQLLVGKNGDPVYKDPETGKRTLDGSVAGATRQFVYDYQWVSNLARTPEGEHAHNAANAGPQMATKTAEAYAIFAVMA